VRAALAQPRASLRSFAAAGDRTQLLGVVFDRVGDVPPSVAGAGPTNSFARPDGLVLRRSEAPRHAGSVLPEPIFGVRNQWTKTHPCHNGR